jgi:isoleucyl-tRNA synthetase
MSKSLGNGIEPQKVSSTLGAEIIRLWVAASDYSGDIAGDDKILARVVDAYRRIRNTLRFLLANTSDFDPRTDAVPAGRAARDRPLGAVARGRVPGRGAGALRGLRVPPGGGQAAGVLQRGPGRVLPRRAEGPPVHHRTGACARRSAQTALWQITHAMLRWMAPFLSFTAEEAWTHLEPAADKASIFTRTWWRFDAPDAALLERWARLREWRERANKQIETVRGTGAVGSSLQAELRVGAPPADAALLRSLGEDLKFVFITSRVEVVQLDDGAEPVVEVSASGGTKCERCWHWRTTSARPGAPDDLRPLHEQPARRRRNASFA